MTRRAILAFLALAVLAGPPPAPAEKRSGGNATLYVGARPNRILILDEATESVTGEIALRAGAPGEMILSGDRRRFYIVAHDLETLEVVDIAARASVDVFRLGAGDTRVRIAEGIAADPKGRFLILNTRAATKRVDRFEIGPATLVQYDLEEHKVSRTVPWPGAQERDEVQVLLSPDGRLMYLFAEDVFIYETEGMTQVDRWELSKPVEPGFGRLDFAAQGDSDEEPGFYSGLFSVQDPVAKRRILGMARIDLVGKAVDFWTLGPDVPRNRGRGLSVSIAPGRLRAHGLVQDIGHYEFWTLDLANHRLLSRTEFKGRPRMRHKVSSNGKLIYVYQAGNTIDIYDATSYRLLRTLELDGETTTQMFVLSSRK